jgi:hypothetical protein
LADVRNAAPRAFDHGQPGEHDLCRHDEGRVSVADLPERRGRTFGCQVLGVQAEPTYTMRIPSRLHLPAAQHILTAIAQGTSRSDTNVVLARSPRRSLPLEIIEPDGLAAFLATSPAGRIEALRAMTSGAAYLAVKALIEEMETSAKPGPDRGGQGVAVLEPGRRRAGVRPVGALRRAVRRGAGPRVPRHTRSRSSGVASSG